MQVRKYIDYRGKIEANIGLDEFGWDYFIMSLILSSHWQSCKEN